MYKLIIENKDASEIWEVPFESISLTEKLNKGYSGHVTVNYLALRDYADKLGTTPDAIISSQYREWKLYLDNVILYAGILMHRKLSGSGSDPTVYTISIADYSVILAKRRTPQEDLYDQIESTDILWSIVDDTQNEPNGDAGITRGTHPTTKDRDRTFRYDNILDAIIGMSNAKVSGGYDWEIDPSKILNAYYPTKGEVRDEIILDDFTMIDWSIDRPLAGRITNRVHVLGKGLGANQVTATREDTAPQATWGLCEDVLAETTVGTQSELEDRGDEYLNFAKEPRDVLSCSVRDDNPAINTYSVGDSVRVKINAVAFNEILRIDQRTIKIPRTGAGTVDLSFEPATP